MAGYDVVEEKRPYTQTKNCPSCASPIEVWWTSGMSECFPHFYCAECGSPIHRVSDKLAIWDLEDEEIIARAMSRIVASLPACLCGGQYSLEARPRCPSCKGVISKGLRNYLKSGTFP